MKELRRLWIHLALLGVGSTLAYRAFIQPEADADERRAESVLWDIKPDSVQKVSFSDEDRKVVLVPKRDGEGRYYLVDTEQETQAREDADAGTSAPSKLKQRRFISVQGGEDVLTAVAPLKSYRAIGKVEDKRKADFGFDKPQGKLVVEASGKSRTLTLGALTPGSGDYYARDDATGHVHAVSAELVNRLRYGENRLFERDLHGFENEAPTDVTIAAQGKSRRLVRVEGKKEGFADPLTPTKQDETAGNWLSKITRLRPTEYLEKPQGIGPALVRVEYLDGKRRLGYAELFRATKGAEKEYYVRTEHTRWYGEVSKTLGEQLEQDLGAVVK